MTQGLLAVLLAAGVGLSLSATALAQSAPSPPVERAAPAMAGSIGVEALKGTWIRPDGGYQIVIGDVGPDGRLEAMYFNPNPLPFAKAQAAKDGTTLRVVVRIARGWLRRVDLRAYL